MCFCRGPSIEDFMTPMAILFFFPLILVPFLYIFLFFLSFSTVAGFVEVFEEAATFRVLSPLGSMILCGPGINSGVLPGSSGNPIDFLTEPMT